jgi:hypothetical protein
MYYRGINLFPTIRFYVRYTLHSEHSKQRRNYLEFALLKVYENWKLEKEISEDKCHVRHTRSSRLLNIQNLRHILNAVASIEEKTNRTYSN